MRTLKYAILGLLMQQPATGYDISKAFNGDLGCFWSAKHSQVYPELKHLDEDGLIEYSTVVQGEKLEKKLYQITPAGEEDFMCWLNQDNALTPTPKDVFRLQSYYSQFLTMERYQILLQHQLKRRREKKDMLANRLESNYGQLDTKLLTGRSRGDYLVLLGAVMRENNYIQWLEDSISQVKVWQEVDKNNSNSGK